MRWSLWDIFIFIKQFKVERGRINKLRVTCNKDFRVVLSLTRRLSEYCALTILLHWLIYRFFPFINYCSNSFCIKVINIYLYGPFIEMSRKEKPRKINVFCPQDTLWCKLRQPRESCRLMHTIKWNFLSTILQSRLTSYPKKNYANKVFLMWVRLGKCML